MYIYIYMYIYVYICIYMYKIIIFTKLYSTCSPDCNYFVLSFRLGTSSLHQKD